MLEDEYQLDFFSKTTVSSGSSARSAANSSGHVTLKEIRAEMRPAILIPS